MGLRSTPRRPEEGCDVRFQGGAWSRVGSGVGFLLCWSHAVLAATFYVRTSGSDTNDALTSQTAFASIRTAERMRGIPGDRVIVGRGTCVEGNIEPYGSGTRGQPSVLGADPTDAFRGDVPAAVLLGPPNTEDVSVSTTVPRS